MGDKMFFGFGIKKFMGLGIAMMLFFIVIKTIARKYPVAGVSDVINMA